MGDMQGVESPEGSSEETWENGQDSSATVSDISSSESEQSVESSLETSSTELQIEYSKGMFSGFSGEGIYEIMGTGVLVGLSVSIFLGFISKWIGDTMGLFGKGEDDD